MQRKAKGRGERVMGDQTWTEKGGGNERSLRADTKQRFEERVGGNQAGLELEYVREWELGVCQPLPPVQGLH